MPNGTYGGVRGRKTKVGRKLLRFPPTRLGILWEISEDREISEIREIMECDEYSECSYLNKDNAICVFLV